MSYSYVVRAPVLYVSWKGFTHSDLARVSRQLRELRASTGKPVVYVARIPDDTRKFSRDDHDVLLGFLNGILPSCATIHHVIEGEGFVKSARQATVSTMALATPRPRDFYVHDTVAAMALVVGKVYGVDLDDIVQKRAERVSAVPAPSDRASSAFRKAAKIVTGEDDE